MYRLLSIATLLACAALPLASAQLAPDAYPDCSSADLNSWGSYICGYKNRPFKMAVAEGCLPQSYSATTQEVKGAILLHHGFTACPDSQAALAEQLASEGFHVYVPLIVGHGRVYNRSCDDPDVTCSNGDFGDPIDEFPAEDLIYVKHAADMTKLLKDEFARRNLVRGTHQAGVAGLSLGGPLVLDALTQDSEDNFYTHGLVTNGFFGVTLPPIDRQVLVCLESSENREKCLRQVAGAILEGLSPDEAPQPNATDTLTTILVALLPPDDITFGFSQIQSLVRFLISRANKELKELGPVAELLEETFSWGEGCDKDQRSNGRNGYCTFKFSQLFAAHAFSQNAIVGANRINKNVKLAYQIVQRDGPTRNALIVQSAVTAQSAGVEVGMCVYKTVGECDGSNECGVPHSCMSRVEQEIVAPFTLYWEAGMHADIGNFFARSVMPGVTGDPATPKRDECAIINIGSLLQDPNIIGDVPVLSSLTIRLGIDQLSKFDPTATGNDIASLIRSFQGGWQVSVKDENTAVSVDDSTTTVRVEMIGAPMALHMEDLIEKGELTTLANMPVVAFQLDGREEVLVPKKTASDDWYLDLSGLGFFAAGATCATGAVMFIMRSKDKKLVVPGNGGSQTEMTNSDNPKFGEQL